MIPEVYNGSDSNRNDNDRVCEEETFSDDFVICKKPEESAVDNDEEF